MVGFLATPAHDAAAQQLFDDDVAELGFVMNVSRLWAYQPSTIGALFALMRQALTVQPLSMRERGILVAATASTVGDSYCSLAWGTKLAKASDVDTAAGVIRGDDAGLTAAERALAHWARRVAADPNAATEADVQPLRDNGFSDEQIFAITVYVALRVAFATVNDALGVRPDAEYREVAPDPVQQAVTFGRAIADA